MTLKHFVYTIVVSKRDRSGNVTKQLKLHRIVKGIPKFVGRYNYTFESEAQACYNAIEMLKALPEKVLRLADHPMGGRSHDVLEQYCTIHNLSHTEVESPYR
jgi:hypothetical protein